MNDLGGARYYAYAVAGPEPQGPFEWHSFDPDKVLLDPYAQSVFFPATFDRAAAMRPGSNAGKAPCVPSPCRRARHSTGARTGIPATRRTR